MPRPPKNATKTEPSKSEPDTNRDELIAAARQKATDLELEVVAAERALLDARRNAALAHEEADTKHAELYAEDLAIARANAQENHDRHCRQVDQHRDELAERRTARGHEAGSPAVWIDPDSILTVTVDGATHVVTERSDLKLGHHGMTGRPHLKEDPRHGSRFKVACGMTVDAPHDELVSERFEQRKSDCAACLAELAAPTEKAPSFVTPVPALTPEERALLQAAGEIAIP